MRRLPLVFVAGFLAVGFAGLRAQTSPAQDPTSTDPVSVEIRRWSDYIKTNTATDELWTQARQAAEPALERASRAMRDGRRLLAIQRLAAARELLAASQYVAQQPAKGDAAAFEAEWTRLGRTLTAGVSAARSSTVTNLRPAALRAIAEASLSQVKVYHDASLEYGRNTMPENGFFYLGTARAQLGLVELLPSFSTSAVGGTGGAAIVPRSLSAELDALEAHLLAAYRPPAAIDRHPEFIRASAALKEARELEAAGHRHGALLRYLQAAQRVAPLRPSPPASLEPSAAAASLKDWQSRLSKDGRDHSLAQLVLEEAQAALEGGAPGAPAGNAAAAAIIPNDVLPRYLAALEPAKAAPAQPAAAAVTVTLVRWPYT